MRASELISRVQHAISLTDGTDEPGTVASVRDHVELRNVNVWLLGCSALLASIGLDTNSTAVVIGAMLVSPLMQTILGVGIGLAINDRLLLFKALRNVAIGVGIVLSLSTVYFMLTPLGVPNAQLMSRTTPTLLDVGVAFFGGVAGIVATSRRRPTAAIPGVAIATAILPPVCTAGWGLATGRWGDFLGACYLFFINCVCISVAAFALARALRFSRVEAETAEQAKVVRRAILAAMTITLVPTALILVDVVSEVKARRAGQRFVNDVLSSHERVVLRWDFEREPGVYVPGRARHTLVAVTAGSIISPAELDSLRARLPSFGLPKTSLSVRQTDLTEEQQRLAADLLVDLRDTLRAEVRRLRGNIASGRDSVNVALPRAFVDTASQRALIGELQVFEPTIERVSLGILSQPVEGSPDVPIPIAVIEQRPGAMTPPSRRATVDEYLRRRFGASLRTIWR
jgi:uncharacterized hydrophobic protein (TIGR00271 family)